MQRLQAAAVIGTVALLLTCGCGANAGMSDQAARSAAVINRLPSEDRQPALDQWTCPVCGELLGSGEVPVKRESGGETIFFQSEQCAEEFAKAPDRFRSKATE